MCAFSISVFAQDANVTAEQIALLPYQNIFEDKIHSVSVERKRDALLELRNFRTAEASRLAVPALKDSAEIVRATAAFSVIYLPQDEAVQNLLPLLADKKPLVRRETAYALGAVGDANAVDFLLQTIKKDKVPEVVNAAVVALGQIGDVSAVAELTAILQKKPSKKDIFLRRSAARSVGQIAQIIQTGKVVVLTPETFASPKYPVIVTPKFLDFSERFKVFQPAVKSLMQILQNPYEADDTKREAAFALGAVGDQSAKPILQFNLDAEYYYLAEICRESLLKLQYLEKLSAPPPN
ncbi:MAG: HEAT repeat domain-containing protein [Acidobacteriota bacterium]|nr:HEAT repeat domain-containing protein [Acidobacteriota bacterium]